MQQKLWLTTLTILTLVATHSKAEPNDDGNELFCYPEAHKNTRKSCECNNDSAPPWGLRALHIDCSYKDLQTKDLSEVLPLDSDTLDLSWNSLQLVPLFASDNLRQLNLMHNNISIVGKRNFIKTPKLRELYLSWNSIQSIEEGAFDDLSQLQVLDLSHNNLRALYVNIFMPMPLLETLNLSWNRQLNQTSGIEEVDFYERFGVGAKLHTLKLQACSLTNLVLPLGAALLELDLRRNRLTKVPETIPISLEKIDLSDNLIDALRPSETKHIAHIRQLLMEDMPRLQAVEEDAFLPLKSLENVSFQNCRRLTSFHAHAFGAQSLEKSTLRSMIFRGSALRTFNATLSPVFNRLTVLDLNGMPLHCDCELAWIKQLELETNGRCFKPSRLRGMRLSQARVEDFSCDSWPRWLYGVITLALILLCSAGIYLLVMGLRPHRGVTMRRKIGAGSPYARVTIEPNRQEDNNHY